MRGSTKMHWTTFIDLNIREQMILLRNVQMTLTYFFQNQQFEILISWKQFSFIKKQMITILSLQICLYLYDTWRRVALVRTCEAEHINYQIFKMLTLFFELNIHLNKQIINHNHNSCNYQVFVVFGWRPAFVLSVSFECRRRIHTREHNKCEDFPQRSYGHPVSSLQIYINKIQQSGNNDTQSWDKSLDVTFS